MFLCRKLAEARPHSVSGPSVKITGSWQRLRPHNVGPAPLMAPKLLSLGKFSLSPPPLAKRERTGINRTCFCVHLGHLLFVLSPHSCDHRLVRCHLAHLDPRLASHHTLKANTCSQESWRGCSHPPPRPKLGQGTRLCVRWVGPHL